MGKINNFELVLGVVLEYYTSVVKGLKLKFRKSWELILTFAEVTGKKVIAAFLPPIQNRVKSLPEEVILFDGFCYYLNLLIIQLIFKWPIIRKFGFSKRVFILQRSPTAVERRRTFRCPLVIVNYTSVKAVQKNSNIPKETAFTVAVETVSAFI